MLPLTVYYLSEVMYLFHRTHQNAGFCIYIYTKFPWMGIGRVSIPTSMDQRSLAFFARHVHKRTKNICYGMVQFCKISELHILSYAVWLLFKQGKTHVPYHIMPAATILLKVNDAKDNVQRLYFFPCFRRSIHCTRQISYT